MVHTPAYLIDVMPTLIEAAGAQYPKTQADGTTMLALEGNSLIETIVKGKGTTHEYMFWEHSGHSAIRKGDWKACKEVVKTDWELYDLRTDRVEQINVAKNNPELVKELNDKWYKWANSHQVLPKRKDLH